MPDYVRVILIVLLLLIMVAGAVYAMTLGFKDIWAIIRKYLLRR